MASPLKTYQFRNGAINCYPLLTPQTLIRLLLITWTVGKISDKRHRHTALRTRRSRNRQRNFRLSGHVSLCAWQKLTTYYDASGLTACNGCVSAAMKLDCRSQIRIFGDGQHVSDWTVGVTLRCWVELSGIPPPTPLPLGLEA
jgi:hypothetical protein